MQFMKILDVEFLIVIMANLALCVLPAFLFVSVIYSALYIYSFV